MGFMSRHLIATASSDYIIVATSRYELSKPKFILFSGLVPM